MAAVAEGEIIRLAATEEMRLLREAHALLAKEVHTLEYLHGWRLGRKLRAALALLDPTVFSGTQRMRNAAALWRESEEQ